VKHLNDLKLRLRGRKAQTVCHYVNAVSSCLQSAVTDGLLPANIARGFKRPRVVRPEVPVLEAADGHALLVAAATLDRDPEYRGTRPLEAIIGTALLAGLRRRELFALLVQDVDLDAGVVHVRPNVHYPHRKSRHAVRRVPLWPQLRRILTPYLADRGPGLLFPGPDGAPLLDLRHALDRVFASANVLKPPGKAWHLFRHTYTAMRLQTTDQGAPVSPWTVKAELGHGSLALIETSYGHLLNVRHRLDRVEYRPALKLEREAVAG
jgi:integrase